MKTLKLLTFTSVICAAVFCSVFMTACSKKEPEERVAVKKQKAILPDNVPQSQKKTNFALIDANTCLANSDCTAVYPTCCGEANPPYYVNKKYKDEFIAEYKKINKQELCHIAKKCPISYFGKAKKTICHRNICVEAVTLAASMPEAVAPVKLKEEEERLAAELKAEKTAVSIPEVKDVAKAAGDAKAADTSAKATDSIGKVAPKAEPEAKPAPTETEKK